MVMTLRLISTAKLHFSKKIDDNFTKILDKKYNTDNEIFKNSVLLSTMVLRIFDDLEKEIKDSIHIAEFKSIVLFARNKGRRL